MHKERRDSKRVFKVLYARAITTDDLFYCYANHLSRAGFCLTCETELAVGRDLEIDLRIGPTKTLRLYGEVAWKRRLNSEPKARYILGVTLVYTPDEYLEYVSELVRQQDPLLAPLDRAG